MGVDSWAVDYGLLRDGRLLGLPFHYRDRTRGEAAPRRVHERVSATELYGRTGLQFLPLNTVSQLAADDWTNLADRLLLVPDLLGFWSTGVEAERTNASTTGLLSVGTRGWDEALLSTLDLPRGLFPDLSLGTWGPVGVEVETPELTEAARVANFTHEGGVDGTIRLLTNVMGTWLLSETLRAWGRTALGSLLAAAAEVPGATPVFDVQDPRFVPPVTWKDVGS